MELSPSTFGLAALRMQIGDVSRCLKRGHPVILTERGESHAVLLPLHLYRTLSGEEPPKRLMKLSLSALRAQLTLVMQKVGEGQNFIVTRNNIPLAVLLSFPEYVRLVEGANGCSDSSCK